MSDVKVCFECGLPDDAMCDHHIVPASKGGTKTVPLCRACHGKVHDKTFYHISKLTKDAMSVKRKNNVRISHRIPFGYVSSPDGVHLTEVAAEQAWINKMVTMRNSGVTLNGIAMYLIRNKVFTKMGGKWSACGVRSILKRYQRYHQTNL